MIKTVFYKPSSDQFFDHKFNGKPYVEWFTLEGILYNSGSDTHIIDDKKLVKSLIIGVVKDRFSDNGITRMIQTFTV